MVPWSEGEWLDLCSEQVWPIMPVYGSRSLTKYFASFPIRSANKN
jgi:hypothetical protein